METRVNGPAKGHGYQDSRGNPLAGDPWHGSPLPRERPERVFPIPGRIRLPGFRRYRSGGSMACLDPERLLLSTIQDLTEESMSTPEAKLNALLSIPGALRPSRRRPLPPRAEKLIRDCYGWERFTTAIRDGASVADAGRMALDLGPSASYELRARLEAAGSPTSLFQRTAIELFDRGSIPWGHQVEDGSWSRVFFVRLIGGPEASDAVRRDCPNENHLRAVLRQRHQAGDTATVQFLLFASHSGLWR
jgi:hypothetical protein